MKKHFKTLRFLFFQPFQVLMRQLNVLKFLKHRIELKGYVYACIVFLLKMIENEDYQSRPLTNFSCDSKVSDWNKTEIQHPEGSCDHKHEEKEKLELRHCRAKNWNNT